MIETTSGKAARLIRTRARVVREARATSASAANTIPGPSQPGTRKTVPISSAAIASFVAGLSER